MITKNVAAAVRFCGRFFELTPCILQTRDRLCNNAKRSGRSSHKDNSAQNSRYIKICLDVWMNSGGYGNVRRGVDVNSRSTPAPKNNERKRINKLIVTSLTQ